MSLEDIYCILEMKNLNKSTRTGLMQKESFTKLINKERRQLKRSERRVGPYMTKKITLMKMVESSKLTKKKNF